METKKVYPAIASVMAAMSRDGIAKSKTNKQGEGYKFRGIDDVLNALSGVLSEHQLCILPRVIKREQVERQSNAGKALFYTTMEVEFDLVSAEDGSLHTVRTCGEAMDSGDKSTNKAMSAAYKYMALQTFCIPTEGDNDADAHTHEVAARQRQELPAPTMDPSEVALFLEAFTGAANQKALQQLWTNATARANAIGDMAALDRFNEAADVRIGILKAATKAPQPTAGVAK